MSIRQRGVSETVAGSRISVKAENTHARVAAIRVDTTVACAPCQQPEYILRRMPTPTIRGESMSDNNRVEENMGAV